MGPRARARGNFRKLQHTEARLCASMGARARARGNTGMLAQPLAHRPASLGPRARARGNDAQDDGAGDAGPLPWGRERALAEIQPCWHPAHTTAKRQWGRERALAEMNQYL